MVEAVLVSSIAMLNYHFCSAEAYNVDGRFDPVNKYDPSNGDTLINQHNQNSLFNLNI